MKSIKLILLLALGLLAVNSAPLVARADNNGHHQSGVTGQVQGFILFHNWNVLVVSDSGKVVADLLTAGNGSFTVDLKPGSYVLTAYIRNVGPHAIVWGTPVAATVEKKQFTTVTLPISAPPL